MKSEDLIAQSCVGLVVVECISKGSIDGIGSGFFIDAQDFIATNTHIVSSCDEIRIQTYRSKSSSPARLVLTGRLGDIAIVSFPIGGIKPLKLGNSNQISPVQRIFAIGHPEGLDFTIGDGIGRRVKGQVPGISG